MGRRMRKEAHGEQGELGRCGAYPGWVGKDVLV